MKASIFCITTNVIAPVTCTHSSTVSANLLALVAKCEASEWCRCAGQYEANQHLILGRYIVTPTQRTLLTMHAHLTTRSAAASPSSDFIVTLNPKP